MSDGVAAAKPSLLPAEKAAFRDFWLFMEQHTDALQSELVERLSAMPEWGPLIRSMTPEQMKADSERSRELQRRAFMDDDWQPYLDDMHRQGMQYARAGTSFGSWFKVLSAYREAVRGRLVALARTDFDKSLRIGEAMNQMMDLAM